MKRRKQVVRRQAGAGRHGRGRPGWDPPRELYAPIRTSHPRQQALTVVLPCRSVLQVTTATSKGLRLLFCLFSIPSRLVVALITTLHSRSLQAAGSRAAQSPRRNPGNFGALPGNRQTCESSVRGPSFGSGTPRSNIRCANEGFAALPHMLIPPLPSQACRILGARGRR